MKEVTLQSGLTRGGLVAQISQSGELGKSAGMMRGKWSFSRLPIKMISSRSHHHKQKELRVPLAVVRAPARHEIGSKDFRSVIFSELR